MLRLFLAFSAMLALPGVLGVSNDQNPGTVAGVVLDATSRQPVGHATVRARPTAGVGRAATVRADSQGRFAFQDLRQGQYSLSATAAGYVQDTIVDRSWRSQGRVVTSAPDETTNDHLIFLLRASLVTGTVVDGVGDPAVNVRVQALAARDYIGYRRWDILAEGRTDDRGLYRLSALPPGRYLIVVPAAAARGSAASGAPTVFHPASTTAALATSVILGSGEERAAVDVQLPRAAGYHDVSGRVSVNLSGDQAAVVRLAPEGPLADFVPSEVRTASVSLSGDFVFQGVPPGTYQVSIALLPPPPLPQGAGVVENGMISLSRGVVLPPTPDADTLWASASVTVRDEDLSGIVLNPRIGARIKGRIVLEGADDSQPPAFVVVTPADGQELGPIPLARVEGDRTFRSVGLPPGLYELCPWPQLPGARSWSLLSMQVRGNELSGQPLELADQDIESTITVTDRRTGLVGSTVDDRGRPVPDGFVYLIAAEPPRRRILEWSASRVSRVRADSRGVYTFDAALPGEYMVVATTTGWSPTEATQYVSGNPHGVQRVTLTAGQVRSVRLTTVSTTR